MAETDLQSRLLAVAALWRRALSGPQHAAGCSCMGGFLLAPPSAQDLEEDVLDYLRHRYRTSDAALGDRLRDREAALRSGAAEAFPSFLQCLASALPAASREQLLTDLEVTLRSIAGPVAGLGRFACI